MFNYTHELVINKIDTSITKETSTGVITIERGGEYHKEFVQGGVIWKTVAVPGKLDKVTLDVNALSLTEGTDYALSMFVKLVDPHALFEYGYPNYNSFGKQILISFTATGTPATDAQTILESILPTAVENDLTFVKGSVSGSSVILEVGHTGLRFDSIGLSVYDPTTCDSCIGEYKDPKAILDHADWNSTTNKGKSVLGSAITHTVVGVDPFGTGEWLIHNLRFPSYPNIRYGAIGESNYPIAGENYTMFSFAYESPRPGLGGISGVGQQMVAVTRHIYYVKASAASDFETLLGKIGTVTETTTANFTDTSSRTEKSVNEVANA